MFFWQGVWTGAFVWGRFNPKLLRHWEEWSVFSYFFRFRLHSVFLPLPPLFFFAFICDYRLRHPRALFFWKVLSQKVVLACAKTLLLCKNRCYAIFWKSYCLASRCFLKSPNFRGTFCWGFWCLAFRIKFNRSLQQDFSRTLFPRGVCSIQWEAFYLLHEKSTLLVCSGLLLNTELLMCICHSRWNSLPFSNLLPRILKFSSFELKYLKCLFSKKNCLTISMQLLFLWRYGTIKTFGKEWLLRLIIIFKNHN